MNDRVGASGAIGRYDNHDLLVIFLTPDSVTM
jgi:hypothetical protein